MIPIAFRSGGPASLRTRLLAARGERADRDPLDRDPAVIFGAKSVRTVQWARPLDAPSPPWNRNTIHVPKLRNKEHHGQQGRGPVMPSNETRPRSERHRPRPDWWIEAGGPMAGPIDNVDTQGPR